MRLELTTPDGRHFEVDAAKIDTLEEAPVGLYATGTKAVLSIGGRVQAVRETVEQIRSMESKRP